MKNYLRLGWLFGPICLILILAFWLGLHGHKRWQNVLDAELSNVKLQTGEITYKYDWKGNGLVTFWFDDGWLSEYENGVLYLDSVGLRGALAVTTDYLLNYEAYMNWAQVKKTIHKGWEVSSHSRTHNCEPHLMSSDVLYQEVVGSKQALADHGIVVNDYVAPCGRFTDEMKSLTGEHYRALRVTDMGTNPVPLDELNFLHSNTVSLKTTNEEIEKWVKDAEDSKEWLILVFHQIDYSGEEYSVTPEQLREIVRIVMDSKLSVVTPSEVYSLSSTN